MIKNEKLTPETSAGPDEQNRVEKTFLESEVNLRAILNSTGDGLLVADNEGHVIHYNKKFQEMWSISEELINTGDDHKLLSFVVNQLKKPEEFLGKVDELYHNAITSSDLIEFKDGRTFERRSNPLLIGDRIKGRVWGFRDITEQIRAGEALKESENRYRNLIESQGEGVGTVDTTECFVFANRAAEKIFGVAPGELVNRNLKEFVIPEHIDRMLMETEKRSKEKHSTYELDIITPAGERKSLLITATPQMDSKGKHVGTFGIFRDLTERKQAELLLERQARELKELNETKDMFFSIIAHDLRSPFNTIMGFTDLLINDFNDYDLKEVEKFIGLVGNSAKQAYALLENLLLWARSQTGVIEFQPEVIDLHSRVIDAISLVESQSKRKNIQLICDIKSHCIVFADKNMIDTILRNLLTNAIKFTRQDGQIMVSAGNLNNHVEISVMDNGMGISKESVEKLFTLEGKEATPGTANEKGSGLGLILCREFVNRHGGKIWVESEPGKGSNFKFTLPVS